MHEKIDLTRWLKDKKKQLPRSFQTQSHPWLYCWIKKYILMYLHLWFHPLQANADQWLQAHIP